MSETGCGMWVGVGQVEHIRMLHQDLAASSAAAAAHTESMLEVKNAQQLLIAEIAELQQALAVERAARSAEDRVLMLPYNLADRHQRNCSPCLSAASTASITASGLSEATLHVNLEPRGWQGDQ